MLCGQVVSTVSSENRGLSWTTTNNDLWELASVIPMRTSSLTRVGYPEDKGFAKKYQGRPPAIAY